MDHRYVIMKFNIYDFLLDYLPLIIMVVFLTILYIKGKDVREAYHQKNNPIDNVPEEVLDKKIQEWQPFKK